MAYASSIIADGTELDRRLEYVRFLEQSNSQPVGIEWDTATSSPTVKRIDANGNEFTPSSTFFDNHRIWGAIRRLARNRSTGAFSYGTNAAGAGLTLTGASGDIFDEFPSAKCRFWASGTKKRIWVAPFNFDDTRYSYHPSAVMRGGTARSKILVAAYEAGFLDDNGTIKLTSVSGTQPFTGSAFKSRTFTSGGTTAIQTGEVLTGATSGAYGTVAGFHLTGGSWAGGDAAGTVYLRLVTGTFQSENLNGSLAGSNCCTIAGDASAVTLTMDQAEGYANALGSGFGVCNPWTDVYIQLLQVIECGTFNVPAVLGKGVCLRAQGTGFAGVNTGADSVDSQLAANGTGVGTGTDGYTPVVWRGLENWYGNCWEFMIGLNMYLSDGSYHIIKRDGTGTLAATIPSGSYETGTGTVPLADGYITTVQADEMGALAFVPLAVAGSDSTYFCDYNYYPRYSPSIVTRGGAWYHANFAGPACRSANNNTTGSGVIMGARIEYIGA